MKLVAYPNILLKKSTFINAFLLAGKKKDWKDLLLCYLLWLCKSLGRGVSEHFKNLIINAIYLFFL